MTKHPTAPAAEPSVADSERAVSEAAAELGDIRLKIAEAEAELPKLAQSDDDEAFEAKSLEIERLRRSKMRAAARLEQAKASLTEAKANEKEGRRRSLFTEGQKAAAEVARLAGEYAKHAGAIAGTLKAIEASRAPIEAANRDLPEGERRIDALHTLLLYGEVNLPAAHEGGPDIWWQATEWTPGPLIYRSDMNSCRPRHLYPVCSRFRVRNSASGSCLTDRASS